jgi:hypothetical protein
MSLERLETATNATSAFADHLSLQACNTDTFMFSTCTNLSTQAAISQNAQLA